MPSRSASSATEASSRNPSSISRLARATVVAVPFHAGLPGAVSGRQRRQGRKSARSAAAEPKNDICRPRGPYRADRTTVDPGGPHTRKERAIECPVSRQASAVACVPIETGGNRSSRAWPEKRALGSAKLTVPTSLMLPRATAHHADKATPIGSSELPATVAITIPLTPPGY
jgi:hypothetical protein